MRNKGDSLHRAILDYDKKTIKKLLIYSTTNINATDKYGTPLLISIIYRIPDRQLRYTALCLAFAFQDLEVNAADRSGQRAITAAIHMGDLQVFKRLLADTRIDLHPKNILGYTALRSAIPLNNSEEMLTLMVIHKNFDIQKEDAPALLRDALLNKRFELAKLLFVRGAPLSGLKNCLSSELKIIGAKDAEDPIITYTQELITGITQSELELVRQDPTKLFNRFAITANLLKLLSLEITNMNKAITIIEKQEVILEHQGMLGKIATSLEAEAQSQGLLINAIPISSSLTGYWMGHLGLFDNTTLLNGEDNIRANYDNGVRFLHDIDRILLRGGLLLRVI